MQLDDKALITILGKLNGRLADMEGRLKELEKEKSSGHNIHLEINEVNIESFQLDQLSYFLDRIDVKSLSGMMNLGNSFYTPANKQKPQTGKKGNARGTKTAEKNSDDARIRILVNGKETPYALESTTGTEEL
ncbi:MULTISPECIES: hypothetical protein [Bacillaceae]|uniref:Uncharacterized protein n=2 Tax=Bacillus infantis TaxID=324767 RepID=U5LDU6_9BACI|nr:MULTISPECIES: hypothetical protein [Bacillus]AGX04866.1 hypothetical protein N288_14830 [Bacillus infantis NRRL B-14911]EAR68045.1 hypothetical protein B14911_25340 [Bacillus sp. NRRL B-14911]MCA1035265.1 hypothetical protein [Bacillus infantis]MDW2877924.1 hypothetical protein [Bacillus infantis]PLR74926.1 hypothetical protein CYJ37_04760 [Bacillus sp. UMB0728]